MQNCKTARQLSYPVVSNDLLCNVENKNDKIIRHKHVFSTEYKIAGQLVV